jgi:hypothetical protein
MKKKKSSCSSSKRKSNHKRKSIQPPPMKKTVATGKGSGGAQMKGKQAKKPKVQQPIPEDTVRLVHGVDELVWLSTKLQLPPEMICQIYRVLCRRIFTVYIPGWPRRRINPTEKMLKIAKKKVLKFYSCEEKAGERSAVRHAFMLASGEEELNFDWEAAKERVRGATYDRRCKVDKWEDCLAMSHGDSQGEVEIGICGHRPMTQQALTALLCHEGLHNMARRTRPGQKYLSTEIEHLAMALMGDPQL